MAYDLEEQEQLDALKAWWAKYGNLVLGVVTLVLVGILSWQGWNWYQRNQAATAGGYFEALQTALRQNNPDQAVAASATLRDNYAGTVYAPRGALLAAQGLLNAGDAERARTELAWVVANGKDAALAAVARVRLAGVLLDLGDYDAALAQVSGNVPAGYEALYADRRGDILFAKGERAQARAAWQEALDAFEAASPLRPVVQLKIDALGAAAA
ncbi:tetratricopeptide repeat protein [Verticiella sediminum]|uniref:Ancillary SecYEG translocon subunit n=1 Tax=Verticiella sediminum TaxID=1247510 RepID=A0A556ADS9_9BURK|nr:tetratricopeptide repeat protein [Verticiella sediminum]TSH91049.1 tetratricopeptide repeat protein [Verticiella sediminum]